MLISIYMIYSNVVCVDMQAEDQSKGPHWCSVH